MSPWWHPGFEGGQWKVPKRTGCVSKRKSVRLPCLSGQILDSTYSDLVELVGAGWIGSSGEVRAVVRALGVSEGRSTGSSDFVKVGASGPSDLLKRGVDGFSGVGVSVTLAETLLGLVDLTGAMVSCWTSVDFPTVVFASPVIGFSGVFKDVVC
jgi:hypothetical protein